VDQRRVEGVDQTVGRVGAEQRADDDPGDDRAEHLEGDPPSTDALSRVRV
jgi:hypothetical protein